ncbi:MAG: 3-phosphoshikimate 1-carboxyvinyltransferase [Candidatus Nanopelagicales bacterium]
MNADAPTTAYWSAPTATGPLVASVEVPGSKSITNRAFIIAAIGSAPAVIHHPLIARDTQLMLSALTAMGTGVDVVDGGSVVRIEPRPLLGPAEVDCGLAGTLMRFLPPVATLATGPISFRGDSQARARPLTETLTSLRALGAEVDDAGAGTLPFTVHGAGRLPGGDVTLDASRSSQFVSGLLLSGARFDQGVAVHHHGGELPSLPHISMTLDLLRQSGADVSESIDSTTQATWAVQRGTVDLVELTVEPDLSNAAVFLAAAMVTGGSVTIARWPTESIQPGQQILAVLQGMGAQIDQTATSLTLTGPDQVSGIDVDLRQIGEVTPTVAAIASLAVSPTVLRGVGHLRGHETDRLAALVTEINRLGGDATETDDGLAINPRALRSTRVRTYHDHRMATFAAIIGLIVPGVEVENIATTGKTLPDFPARWADLVATT